MTWVERQNATREFRDNLERGGAKPLGGYDYTCVVRGAQLAVIPEHQNASLIDEGPTTPFSKLNIESKLRELEAS